MNISNEKNVKTTMIAGAGVVYKYGQNGEVMVLLIQRSKDDHWPLHYEFPRGKCDKPVGEDKRHCVVREIKEETGLNVTIEKFLGKFEYLAMGGTRKTICYNYLCKMNDENQKVNLSKEHQTYKWITQLGQAEILILPDQVKILERVLSVNNSIYQTPENGFTINNNIEEYLRYIQ